jgi:RNA polymerase sigma-70 factor, ECF subfamily
MDFERFRPRLRALVALLLDPKLKGKLDESGVVQKTLMDAHRDGAQCRGKTEPEQYAWIRRMLENDLKDEIKKARAGIRDVGLEVALDDSALRIDGWIEASQSSPGTRAAWVEEVERLVDAVAQLPEDQRTAIELHHFRQCPLQETAALMGKSLGAVASLIHRGVTGLRDTLGRSLRA